MVERDVILQLGGWDETFRSRVHSELFLRLNPVCSIAGLPIITYQLYKHGQNQVSKDSTLRQRSFEQLVHKHQVVFDTHPKMFADFVYKHALMSYQLGQTGAASSNLLWALQIHPRYVFRRLASPLLQSLSPPIVQRGKPEIERITKCKTSV